MFALYHNKEKFCLKIYPWESLEKLQESEIKYWNENIFLSNDRKLLNEKAINIKEMWLKEYNEAIEKIKNMKIIRRYK